MIFFLTTLILSSKGEVFFRNLKKHLLRNNSLIPLPFTVFPVGLSTKPPQRPTRKMLAEGLPEKLTAEGFSLHEDLLFIDYKEEFHFKSTCPEEINRQFFPGKFHLGQWIGSSSDLSELCRSALPDPLTKFSVALYEIQIQEDLVWWENMSWIKLWEVKKGSQPKRC